MAQPTFGFYYLKLPILHHNAHSEQVFSNSFGLRTVLSQAGTVYPGERPIFSPFWPCVNIKMHFFHIIVCIETRNKGLESLKSLGKAKLKKNTIAF